VPTAYAHIAFNIIGVMVTIPLFFLSMEVLRYAVGWFGSDPGTPVMVNGRETYPLVPVAIGLYSTFLNIFNVILLYPFIGVFERVLSRIGRDASEDVEDYSTPKYLTAEARRDLSTAQLALQQEIARHVQASALFLDTARGVPTAPKIPAEHQVSLDLLSRDIRGYAASLFTPELPESQADRIASLIEEADYAASLGETLHQVARRILREESSSEAKPLVEAVLNRMAGQMRLVLPAGAGPAASGEPSPSLTNLRERTLRLGQAPQPGERGAILALLGSAERAGLLVNRLEEERRSTPRLMPASTQTRPSTPLTGPAIPLSRVAPSVG
jgi:phosphate:Na+ symporter